MDAFILLIVGIVGLWLGTELTVKNAIKLASRFNVSELFIGLTILAFGTDLPEVVVAISGAIHNTQGTDTSGIIVGNAIGSSISQISIILGITALLHYLNVGKVQVRYLAIELIGSVILLALVSFDNVVTWNDGAILIIAFLIYFFTHLQRERYQEVEIPVEKKEVPPSPILPILLLILGLSIVAFSSELTVDHALEIAALWGVRQSFVGAIVIGLGTSLPELAISLRAVIEKKPGLSIGNIIGSNIFDSLIPIGIASLIADINVVNFVLWVDLPVLLVMTVAVIWFLSRKRGLQKWEGAGLIMLYVGYAIIKYVFS